jgi:hypothetical protein
MTIVVNIANTTSFLSSNGSTSISNTTGALVVTGGLGVSGNVYSANIYTNGVYYASNGLPFVSGSGGGGASANGTIYQNNTAILTSYTIPANTNGLSVGPIFIANGAVVNITPGQRWIIL